MSTGSGIIAGGNWIVDRLKVIDSWPVQDTLVTIKRESVGNGGGAYNVLKNLARLGASCPLSAVGLVGEDAGGRWIREDCQAHGIDTSQLHLCGEAATSYTDVMTVASTGRRTFFHHRGANALLGPKHFNFDGISAKVFYLGYLLLLDELDKVDPLGVPRAVDVLRRAKAAGMITAVDCVSVNSDHYGAVVIPALGTVDILFANDWEAERLTGIALRHDGVVRNSELIRSAGALLEKGVSEWVIVHLPEVVVAYSSRGETLWQASVNIPRSCIRGTSGAGDAFASGVLFGLIEGLPMNVALRVGVCVAAASLRYENCSEGVESVDSCLGLGRQYGFSDLPEFVV